ncbi:hypothetical protein B0H14DRAFT_3543429 [Mycena olivaceomarginata]|nr:hypothetical protein B0H14DRAFT_3543429 [Mycena olivaceomarginata]
MSSPSTTPIDDDLDLLQAMAQSSPIAAPSSGASKRNHSMMAGNEGSGDEDQPDVLPVIQVSQNIVALATRYTSSKRLCSEQSNSVLAFMNDAPALRDAKLLTHIFALETKVDKILVGQPSFEVSIDLQKNISSYASAVLLSSKITIYKGDGPKNVLLGIIKKYRFDIPDGVEKIPADWAKIVAEVQEALTQKRSKIKKLIGWSLKVNKTDETNGPDSEHQNIFTLAQNVVKGSQCTVNIVLCARIALMRSVYLQHPGMKFWNKLDKRLKWIRDNAGGDAKKISKAFRHVLSEDQSKHGVNDYTIDETAVDKLQQDVDDLIDATVIDAAT